MENRDLISIIVPVYNVEKYINRCIKSLLCQTYDNLEIILVDDGSTDRSGRICDGYATVEKIQVYHKPNEGLSSARNYGLERSNGKYVAFIDSDDWVSDDYIQYLYELILCYAADISRCSFQMLSEENYLDEANDVIINNVSGKEALKLMLRQEKGMTTSVCTSLFKKECFENIKFPEGKYFEDLGTTYKILGKMDKIVISTAKKYAYFLRNDSIAHSGFKAEYMDELYFAKQILEYVSNQYSDLVFDACIRIQGVAFHLYMMMSEEQLKDLMYRKYRDILLETIKKYRFRMIISKKTTKKVRMGSICSLFGMRFVRKIYYKLGIYGR